MRPERIRTQLAIPRRTGQENARLDFGGLFAKRGAPTHHKEWWDILPEHKDRTRSTRLDLIKAVASPGKAESELVVQLKRI